MAISSVLFAAGHGRRLRPLTDGIPKPALPVLDVPLAAWGLAALTRHAPTTVVNASYMAGEVIAALHATGITGWESLNEGAEAFGTAGTLRALRDRLSPRVVTWNGDAVGDLHLPELIAAHHNSVASATLLVREVDQMADLALDGSAVSGFIDRRKTPAAAGARFLGIAIFERHALDALPDHRPAGLGETLLRDLANTNGLNVHRFEGYLRDVGTPVDYLLASLDVLNGTGPLPPVDLPGDIVEVDGGRAYLGPGTNAAPAALGPGAVLLAGAQVEPGARISNSIVLPGAVVPAREVLQDTIWPRL